MLSPEEIFSRLEDRRNSNIVHNTTWRYATVLFSIGVLAALIFWGSYEVTLQQTHDANVIEVSSKQRTLRLSAEMLARQIIEENAQNRRDILIDKLETVLTDLENSHNVLAYGQIWNGPALPRIPEAQSYIFGPKSFLDVELREFIEQGHKLLITNIDENEKITDAFSEMMEAHSSKMDFALDGIVAAYKHDSANKIARLQAIQITGLFLIIAVLVFSAVFVFRPMARRIKDDFDNLEDICVALNAALGDAEFSRVKFEELGTVNVELLEQLEVTKRRAEKANLAKSEFLSSMSHELRTPMNAILGFAQMLDFNPQEPLSDTQKSCVKHIMKGGQHLLGLIDQILDLSKIESRNLQLASEPVLPSTLFNECLEMLRPLADKKGIELSGVKKSHNLINVDPARFKQVLINLLSNAIKYNVDNGSVKFGCLEKEGSIIQIFVSDTGPGIAEEDQAGLFEPFNRLGKETSETEGTGVGLTISKQLVEAMGGHIGFESEVGKGSTFWVEFPAIESKTEEQIDHNDISETDEQQTQKGLGATVLYIEDNPANLELMKRIINSMDGVSLISAHNAELGMSMAEEQQPNLILMDINLPGMDGIAAMKVLSKLVATKDIPVIAISAAAMKNDVERGMEAGFKAYLTKPFKVPEIIEAIENELAV